MSQPQQGGNHASQPTPTRPSLARFALCGAFAAAATVALADTAGAVIPERTIRSECKSDGGTYYSHVIGGERRSFCTYRALDGEYYMDKYINGEYVDTY